jgi:hypothetical protein
MISRVFAVFLYVLMACPLIWGQEIGTVKEGQLDLRKWNPAEHPVIWLDGEWQFYWKRLLRTEGLRGDTTRIFAQLSIPWNEQVIAGERLPKNGYASYALQILMPGNMRSVSFAVPAVFNCYAFWVNDRLICSSGKVGTKAAETIPRWQPQTVTIPSPGDTLQVIFQISNFQHTRGGCAEIMRIGDTGYLTGMASAFHNSGIALIIFFGIVGIGALIIFFIVRPVSFLYLAMLSIAFTVRFIFSDLYFYNDFGIEPGWEVAAKIEYLTIPLIVLCGALFISSIYPHEFKRILLYIFVVINALLIGVVIFADSSMFSPLLLVLQVEALTFIGYVMYTIVRALIFQRAGAWVSVLGLTVFTLVGFYNVYAFITVTDLNRIVIHSGYALALLLNVASLLYRTPMRLQSEEQDILRFTDLYKDQGINI